MDSMHGHPPHGLLAEDLAGWVSKGLLQTMVYEGQLFWPYEVLYLEKVSERKGLDKS